MTSRREFLQGSLVTATGLAAPTRPNSTELLATAPDSHFLDVQRPPDAVTLQVGEEFRALRPTSDRLWESGRSRVGCTATADSLKVTLSAPGDTVSRIHLRWHGSLQSVRLLLGDAWERSYGDLEWRGFAPDRVMPWYVARWDGVRTDCCGVRIGANAFCFWRVDPQGISLWADVRSGGVGLKLAERELDVCEVVSRRGAAGTSPFVALHTFCRVMCPTPLLPRQPVYGHNDWYYAYGNNSATTVIADAQHIVELSPTGKNRPFAVIDDGWQPERSADTLGVGLWDRGNERFPNMADLASRIRTTGARPGIWFRPLLAAKDTPDSWRLTRARSILDPSLPDTLHKVTEDIARLRTWGYELIKHDYSTFDIMGRWGSGMNSSLTRDGWTFGTGSNRTTAEVINELYRTMRRAAGDAMILGCNTVSHLSAGQFELCRIGDDTSGTEWGRVPRMGVNTLAFRGVQHGAFYAADPDCIGVTTAIPWSLNRQWLDLLARSGTMTFVSIAPNALGTDQRRDLRAALALAAEPRPLAEPIDWQRGVWPTEWRTGKSSQHYDWVGNSGLPTPG